MASPGSHGDAAGGRAVRLTSAKAYGTQFINSNIIPDFAQVPPTHQNPFARGQIVSAQVGAGGAATRTSASPSRPRPAPAPCCRACSSAARWRDHRQGCGPELSAGRHRHGDLGHRRRRDRLAHVGAQTGTYPGVVAYFQERRAYAYTLNNPDTYFMSQPGAFTNFDSRIPTIDTDAIIGSPWSVQVNGIQWMVPTSGGLMVFTGLQTWLLVGQGSFATNVAAISPSSQVTNPQPEIGCSPTLSRSRSITTCCSRLELVVLLRPALPALCALRADRPHAERAASVHRLHVRLACLVPAPYKLMWAVRDDGALLSLTYPQGRAGRRLGAPRHAGAGGEQLRGDRAAGRCALSRGAAVPRRAHRLHDRADGQPHLVRRRGHLGGRLRARRSRSRRRMRH
jgi:hypothetical protein